MKLSRLLKVSVLLSPVAGLLLMVSPVVAQGGGDEDVITAYVSTCEYNTDAEIFSWHGVNMDGQPPVDLDRQSVDFLCEGKRVYAPYSGDIYGYTPRWGGLILIDDADHEVCIVLLGMRSFEVNPGDTVIMGDYLGVYGYHIHMAAVGGTCADANWYNAESRDRERPIAFREFGFVLPSDIHEYEAVHFVSQNPAGQVDLPPDDTNHPPAPLSTGGRELPLH